MPKTANAIRTYRFDQMASMINDRVDDPAESGVERYVGLEHLDANSLQIRRWGDITDVESTKLRFKPGDIVFGKRRVYQRKLAVADFEGICSAHAMVLRARPEVVLPDFLPFFMQSDLFMKRALAISVGSLSPTINWTDLAQQEFVLPPIEEQHRLASALKASAVNEQAMRTCDLAAQALVVAVRHAVIPEPSETGTYCIGDFARHKVDKVALSSVPEFRLCGVYSFGRGLIDRGTTLPENTQYQYMHRIKSGTVVLSKLKAWEGAIAVASCDFEGSLASPEYPTFELDRSTVLPEFMDQVCRSPWFWHKILQRCKGTADRRSRIHPQEFLKVPFPKLSIAQQMAAVDRVAESMTSARTIASRYERSKGVTRDLVEFALLGGKAKEPQE
jgi:type I restriction enzyme S subunit